MARALAPLSSSTHVLVASSDARVAALREVIADAGLAPHVVDPGAVSASLESPPCAALIDGAEPSAAELVTAVRAAAPDARCVLIVERASSQSWAVLSRARADTFVPWSADARAIRLAAVGDVTARPDGDGESRALVTGSSAVMDRVWQDVMMAAGSRAPLLICGETGVGKEVFARAVHRLSGRRGAFVAVNCAALPETLLEAELFGYERGAFTGASATKRGRFELADGGTLLLDEIGDLPPPMQVKLLRVLQERRFERLGGLEALKPDVRIVAATHRDLDAACEAGQFRRDLFYRLNVLELRIPALRERGDDVLELWDAFVEASCREEGRAPLVTTAAARERLRAHAWDGNVRELQNAALQAVASARDTLDVGDLPRRLRVRAPARRSHMNLVGIPMRDLERMAIEQNVAALGAATAAAKALGVSERTIYARLRRYREDDRLDDGTAARATASTTHVHLRVLLAEDDDDLRAALAELLREEGFEVIAVADGRAALRELDTVDGARACADVLVTDVRMPRTGGLEVLEALRARGHALPVIVMSAFGDPGTRDRALALGASMFMEKPIAIPDLQRAILSLRPDLQPSKPC